MIGGAVALIICLKVWTIRNRIVKQTNGYIDPSYCISHLEKQIERVDLAEKLLDNYVSNSQESPDRFRNIALMVAFINSKLERPQKNPKLEELLKSSTKVEGVAGQYK